MSTEDVLSSVSTIEQPTMAFGRGGYRYSGCGCDFGGGCGSFGGDVTHMVADKVALLKDHVNANIVRGIITSLRSAERILVALNGHN